MSFIIIEQFEQGVLYEKTRSRCEVHAFQDMLNSIGFGVNNILIKT